MAFRRDSDEEHKEPRFELPIPAGPNLVTPRGLALIEARIAELNALLAGTTDAAAEPLRRDLRYWQTRRSTAQVILPPNEGVFGLGATVSYRLNGVEKTVEIVGDDEADPKSGRIAWSAPLARALAPAEIGETVDFNGHTMCLELIGISSANG